MTKLTDTLNSLKNCRKKFPLSHQPLVKPAPRTLKNYVDARKTRGQEQCMTQFLAVMDCWERHENEPKPCQLELEAYQKCYRDAWNDIRERKKNDRDGVIPMGVPSIKLTSNQKNNLLKRHVQVKTSR